MERFILRFTGREAPADSDLVKIRSAPGVTVLDDAAPRMLLVEASSETVGELVKSMPGWISTRERMVRLPDPRPKIRSS